nr:transposase family protein [Mycobacterium sp. SM1]
MYGPNVIAALVFCWAVLGMPAGKRLAPIPGELVERLRRCEELDIDDDTAALRAGMSAATIDRRLASERKKHELKGRSHTKPGSLLKSQIPTAPRPIGTTRRPGFVEIDLVGHEGGNAAGAPAYTLTVTDIATGWTENRSVPNKARKWVLAALDDIAKTMPFPILDVDSDCGSEFINYHLLAWCEQRQVTFTCSRSGNKNDGCYGEQKNWAVVPTVVGYHRYDTKAELLLLNKIWTLQSLLTNYFYPQQKTRLQGPQRRQSVQKNTTPPRPRTAAPSAIRRSSMKTGRSSPTPTRASTRRRAAPDPGPDHQDS